MTKAVNVVTRPACINNNCLYYYIFMTFSSTTISSVEIIIACVSTLHTFSFEFSLTAIMKNSHYIVIFICHLA